MSLGREHQEFVVPPAKRFVVFQHRIDRDIGADCEKRIPVVVVVVRTAGLPDQLGLVEQVSFKFGNRDLGPLFTESWRAGALVTVVMGVKDPFDLLEPGLLEVINDSSGAGGDQQPVLTVGNQIDIAGVGQPVEMFRDSDQSVSHCRFCEG